MQKTQSAGGVVLNTLREVAVVSQRGDSWSLPKGHVDPGETPEEAARREVREETGIADLNLIRTLGTYERHRIGKDGVGEDQNELKEITIFLFTTLQEALTPEDPANPTARWIPIKDVADTLTHPKDKEFFLSIKGALK